MLSRSNILHYSNKIWEECEETRQQILFSIYLLQQKHTIN